MKLYSYTLRVDDGAAPNPYGGVCTLAICKPAIRRTAQVGDWLVGLGPTNGPDGQDLSHHVIYAMQVSRKLTFAKYDSFCQRQLRIKIPVWTAGAPFERRVGDCLYEHIGLGRFRQRVGVHVPEDMETDLGGRHVLLAEKHFFYFGDNPVLLPEEFESIRHPTQGHKVHVNEGLKHKVIEWMTVQQFGCRRTAKRIYGQPLHKSLIQPDTAAPLCSPCVPGEAPPLLELARAC